VLAPYLDHFAVVQLYLACVAIPIFGLVQVRAGIAQSYDWPMLASPDEVAAYYVGARLLALAAFIYFSIANASAHKFTEYHLAGDRKQLVLFFAKTIKWALWPSLAPCAAILAYGRPLLALFGPSFARGYNVMFTLAVGMVGRAAFGPAERLLNMLGERKQCALIYAGASVSIWCCA
jgi:O-antigen/teichoic acid export membrane protein